MNKRLLGRTGIKVSEIAFGGVEIGMPYGIGIKNKTDMLSETDAVSLLRTALDNGINLFDTARAYGNSEAIMGRAFHGMRERVVICTKFRPSRDDKGNLPGAEQLKKIMDTSLSESLKALQTDYIDVYILHLTDNFFLRNETVTDWLLDLKKKGIVRAIGVSTYKVEETRSAIESGIWDVIQLPFNLMDQSHGALFPLAEQKDVGIVVRSVLFKGILSERGRNLHPELKDVQSHIKSYEEMLNESAPDLPTLATKFALSFRQVSSVLVGIDRKEYLQKSLAAADGRYFDEKILSRLKELRYPEPEFLDLVKWERMGWLK